MDTKKNVRISILDRLLAHEPDSSQENVQFRLADFRHIQSMVIRDLEHLLNTRCGIQEPPKAYSETRRSVMFYGLRDYSSDSPDSGQTRDRMIHDVERAIRWFEPRLKNVKVQLDVAENTHRSLNFKISGLLVVDPIREPVTFDSYYDPEKKAYVISP